MCLTYRRDTPANMVWEEINSETLATQSDTCKGVQAHTTHTLVRHQLHIKQTKHISKKAFADNGRSETKREAERRKAGKLRDSKEVRDVLLLLAVDLTDCSAALLYEALTAVCCCRLSVRWNRSNKYLHHHSSFSNLSFCCF